MQQKSQTIDTRACIHASMRPCVIWSCSLHSLWWPYTRNKYWKNHHSFRKKSTAVCMFLYINKMNIFTITNCTIASDVIKSDFQKITIEIYTCIRIDEKKRFQQPKIVSSLYSCSFNKSIQSLCVRVCCVHLIYLKFWFVVVAILCLLWFEKKFHTYFDDRFLTADKDTSPKISMNSLNYDTY